MRFRNHFLAACLLWLQSLSLPLHTIAQELPLRVLSYNIHHGEGTDGKLDLDRIASVIRQSRADLVALQEVDRNTGRGAKEDQLVRLADLTKMSPVFGKAIDFDGGEYGLGVLTRHTILAHQTHHLPISEGSEQRVALQVDIHTTAGEISLVCTHLDHRRDPQERLAQANELQRILDGNVRPTLLAGDLNATLESDELAGLLTTWQTASLHQLAPTFPASGPERCIDHILLRKRDAWRVIGSQVLIAPVASDHAPLLVELSPFPRSTPARIDRNDTTTYRQADGSLAVASNAEQWETRRDAIKRALQSIMGPLPPLDRRVPLDVRIEEEVDRGRYVQRLITYASEPGNRVPAYLLIPKGVLQPGAESVAAVLCLHPTDDVDGHKVVVGLGGKPNRQYAQELAELGYVTLAPSYPLLANYQPDWRALGYSSGSMKAIWDNVRGIDLLESLPFVSQGGVGVIGHSLGGHNGIYTAVFDDRIKVIVSSCGLDSYLDYMRGDIRGWTSDRYMPRLLDYSHALTEIPFDFHEILSTLAPRPCLIVAPRQDDNFDWKSVDDVVRAARKVYRLHGAEYTLQVAHPDCEHDFPDAMRVRAYELIDQVLRR